MKNKTKIIIVISIIIVLVLLGVGIYFLINNTEVKENKTGSKSTKTSYTKRKQSTKKK